MLLELATEFRSRAAVAENKERSDLLFLAAEYEALAAGAGHGEGERGLTIVIPN